MYTKPFGVALVGQTDQWSDKPNSKKAIWYQVLIYNDLARKNIAADRLEVLPHVL